MAFRISTTSDADRELVDALRQRARFEGITLSEAIRQAFAVRIAAKPPSPKKKTTQ
jgi:hypothetical protein